MATKWVYMFTEGNATMRNLLGGKGANLAEMTGLGLPVPQGFTVTTEACTQYYEDGRKINDEIMGQIMEAMAKLEEITGKKFGDKQNPLLVSVRSGARATIEAHCELHAEKLGQRIDRLMEIAKDGRVDENEMPEFVAICDQFREMQHALAKFELLVEMLRK